MSFLLNPAAFAAQYTLDTDHTVVSFKIRHIFTFVHGAFKAFEGSFVYDPASPETWKADAVIQVASIDTGVEPRDNDLRSPNFFEVEKFPTMTFKSTGVTEVTSTSAKLHGLLKIRDVEKPVVLDLQILGEAKDPWGNESAGFSATTRINRKDFGLTWNKVLETGQLLVGEEVEITIEVTGLRQA
jgi:polyisoprenoid-binding protein YceI